MDEEYIVAFDEGTTSCRTLVYDVNKKEIAAVSRKEFKQIYPKPGWVEHDATEIWECQLKTYYEALKEAGIEADDVSAIGITNQRETVVVWDRETGRPVGNAIVWQCRRTTDECERLKKDSSDMIREKTGLIIDAYFSATKIRWILDNIPGAMERAKRGELLAGTMDSWLIWNMTGGVLHVTDYTNASRTMLFNIRTLQWDDDLLSLFGIPDKMLPKVVASSGVAGFTDSSIMGAKIPVCGIAGDQQSALFGQNCFNEGSAKNTYGTGCFILMNTGGKPVESKNNLLTTIAWGLEGQKVCYALEGSIFIAGAVFQWIRDELKMVKNVQEIDMGAQATSDTGGVYIVPAFTGLGAPYWDMYARGTIVGLTRGSGREHLLRAAIECVAYQSRDVFEAMVNDSGLKLEELKVDGGASASNVLMQFQSDLLNCEVIRPKIRESTAMGAVYLAGLAAGIWSSTDQVRDDWQLDTRFVPNMKKDKRDELYRGWRKAVKRAEGWAEN